MSAKQIIKESAIDNELNELEKASKEKLLTIIKEAKENIDKNNSEKRINKEYYNSISKCLNLETIEEENEKLFYPKKIEKINLDNLNSSGI